MWNILPRWVFLCFKVFSSVDVRISVGDREARPGFGNRHRLSYVKVFIITALFYSTQDAFQETYLRSKAKARRLLVCLKAF